MINDGRDPQQMLAAARRLDPAEEPSCEDAFQIRS